MLAAIQHPSSTHASGPPGPGAAADLEELFTEHHGRVFRTAYRITGNATDAEDVLQTVFLRLLKRDDPPDLSLGAASYLHRAAVNAGLDLLRARRRARTVDLDQAGEMAEGEERSPERRSRGKEMASWLRGAVARLSPRAAEIFTLRYVEGYGNREIAEMLATSQTAVAVILHRTRHRLGKELAPVVGGLSS